MGSGRWTTSSYASYSTSKGYDTTFTSTGNIVLNASYDARQLFRANKMAKELNPKNVMRECCDSEEHPNTIPVILALDVTGSMGAGSAEVAKKLNEVMTELYKKVNDVEFCVMGIGDLAYDDAPIQISQFESDIRIAEQLDKVWLEGGGGGNKFESYTAAWYMGVYHTKLDCWSRGKKGIIITMGDEMLNPYLPHRGLNEATGDRNQADVETGELYNIAKDKFDIYHIAVDARETSYAWNKARIYSENSFPKYLDEDHLFTCSLDNIASAIISIVENSSTDMPATPVNTTNEDGEIVW